MSAFFYTSSRPLSFLFFFFNDTATTEIYTLSLHDALPLASAISGLPEAAARQLVDYLDASKKILGVIPTQQTLVLERFFDEAGGMQLVLHAPFGSRVKDRKSTRLNSSHGYISYAVFCLK